MNKHKKIISEVKDTESAKTNSKRFNAIKILDYLKYNVSDHILVCNNKNLIFGTESMSIASEINPKNKIKCVGNIKELK